MLHFFTYLTSTTLAVRFPSGFTVAFDCVAAINLERYAQFT
jgi:hypothetical protein